MGGLTILAFSPEMMLGVLRGQVGKETVFSIQELSYPVAPCLVHGPGFRSLHPLQTLPSVSPGGPQSSPRSPVSHSLSPCPPSYDLSRPSVSRCPVLTPLVLVALGTTGGAYLSASASANDHAARQTLYQEPRRFCAVTLNHGPQGGHRRARDHTACVQHS